MMLQVKILLGLLVMIDDAHTQQCASFFVVFNTFYLERALSFLIFAVRKRVTKHYIIN